VSTKIQSTDAEYLVIIRISPVIEREFKRRDIFPELCLEKAFRVINGATGCHLVSLERAHEIFADAQEQRYNRDLPRGLPVAYGALASNIASALKYEARRGLLDDPGMEEVQRRQAAASARFQIGDRVLYFRGDDEYGGEATIIGDYRMYSVTDDAGPYITRDDIRLAYRYGYVIQRKGAERAFFVAAYQLTRDDIKPSHLRLVA
jgi:hypothetical protein